MLSCLHVHDLTVVVSRRQLQRQSHAFVPGLQQVKTITALTVAALAEAAAPYGIESFDDVLEPLWKGIRLLRGKVLAAFLKVSRTYAA